MFGPTQSEINNGAKNLQLHRVYKDVQEAARDCITRQLDVTTSAIQLYLYYREGMEEIYTQDDIIEACNILSDNSPVFKKHWLNR